MSIRAKLQLSVLVGGGIAVLVLGFVLVWTSGQVDEALEQNRAVDDIVRGVFELSVVMNDYLQYGEERALAQWQTRHASLAKLLERIDIRDVTEEAILADVAQTHAELSPLFSQLVANRTDPAPTGGESDLTLDRERRLASQLLVKAQIMVTEAFRLAESAASRVASTQRRGAVLVMALTLSILAAVVVFVILVSNGVVARIKRLRQGTEIVASGDLSHRVDERGSDELGDLARAFNVMTHRLKEEGIERKRAEEERSTIEAQLRQQQKLESIGTLASGVAHEINNPLMGIINYAELIADEVADDSIKPYTDGIVKEGNRVATIVRNLLSFARQEKESHSPADLKDIIDNSLNLVTAILRKDQITIDVDVPEDLPMVKCRSQRIQQVVINLLTNAHDALNERYPGYDENKILRITARPFENEGKTWVRMTIEDRGPGIPEELLERIFDPFFTTKPRDEGTGLGLSVSFGIVREHKGRLWVESDPGEHTRFHMDLAADNGWSHGHVEEAEH